MLSNEEIIIIKKAFNAISPIPENDWQGVIELLEKRTLASEAFLWKPGQKVDGVAFILNGTFRYYIERDIEEQTIQFFSAGEFMTDYESFSLKVPTQFYYQALEDAQIIVLTNHFIQEVYNKSIAFLTFGKTIAEQIMTTVRNERLRLQYLSAEDNYRELLEKRPELLQKVPLKMLASYLAITPQHFSRIRKSISHK